MSSKKKGRNQAKSQITGRPSRDDIVNKAKAIMQSNASRMHDILMKHGSLGELGPELSAEPPSAFSG
ncbi:hypothetical protein [Erwinia sp. JUb26]|uniref:hypothetical protein n=1 Tax=Erwinia sp. JUb26 TaxID=2485126 RepID=UPI000F491AED|nr:hypothetical protein [Erwinia sp. JUb26]ROR07804.1 hypothetical protein EC836_106239 [Erwinia sp. JUb26]